MRKIYAIRKERYEDSNVGKRKRQTINIRGLNGCVEIKKGIKGCGRKGRNIRKEEECIRRKSSCVIRMKKRITFQCEERKETKDTKII